MYKVIDGSRDHPYLKKDVPWGFAIYRCSYKDNNAWERMLREIDTDVKETLEHKDYGRPDLLPLYQPVIFDDKEKFDGATSHEIRDHFNVWIEEQIPHIFASPNLLQRMRKLHGSDLETSLGPRWNFCIFVDDICLESLDHMRRFPVVKLLYKHWGPLEPHERNYEVHPWWEDGVTEIDEEDVGWMHMNVVGYVEQYQYFYPEWYWHDFYLRPPSMLSLEESEYPGFWKKKKRRLKLETASRS